MESKCPDDTSESVHLLGDTFFLGLAQKYIPENKEPIKQSSLVKKMKICQELRMLLGFENVEKIHHESRYFCKRKKKKKKKKN